jgi:hypothetical protein
LYIIFPPVYCFLFNTTIERKEDRVHDRISLTRLLDVRRRMTSICHTSFLHLGMLLLLSITLTTNIGTDAFHLTLFPNSYRANTFKETKIYAMLEREDNNNNNNNNNVPLEIFRQPPTLSEQQQQQGDFMELSSLQGAPKVSALSIAERTKRAMLAEAIEDNIFRNAEKLDQLFDAQGLLPPHNRAEAMEIAEETKKYQQQYQELVSGESSSVLNVLEQVLMPPSSSSNNA